jgi:hypothetical protein
VYPTFGSTSLGQRRHVIVRPTCWQYLVGPTLGFVCAANMLTVHRYANVGPFNYSQHVGSPSLGQRLCLFVRPTGWQYLVGPALAFKCEANMLAVLCYFINYTVNSVNCKFVLNNQLALMI